MTIAHCPKCREQVTIPGGASRQARVRCPLCSEEYLLDEALKPLPPLLMVLDDPGAVATVAAPAEMAFVPASASGPDFAGISQEATPALMLEEPEPMAFSPSPASAPAFQFEAGSATGAKRPLKTTARSRPQKKSAGPLRMMVQTIGGGAMGLVIAQLILWWMPGNWQRHNRDPFGLSTKVIPYAPFLVPASLKGEGPVAQDDPIPSTPEAPRGDTSQGGGDLGNSPAAFPPANSQIPDFTFNPNATESGPKKKADKPKPKDAPPQDLSLPADEPVVASPKVDALDLPDLSLDQPKDMEKEKEPGKEPEKAKADKEPEPKDEEMKAEPKPEVPAETPKPDLPTGLKNPPMLTEADVTARTAMTVSANVAWDTAQNPTNDEKRTLITAIFDNLGKLGDALAVVGFDRIESEAQQPIGDLISVLAADNSKTVPIGKLAARQLAAPQANGLALAGTVVGHETRGKWFLTQVKLPATGEPVVNIVSTIDLAATLPPNSNALIVGRLLPDAAAELTGYEGETGPVVVYGMHAVGK